MNRTTLLALALAFFAPAFAFAQAPAGEAIILHDVPLKDETRCVQAAATYHSVNPWVLQAILSVESGFKPNAVNRNQNGTIDVGMAQINSAHFARLKALGVMPDRLMDSCVATYVAAWFLAEKIRQNGLSWYGIATYHSKTRCYNDRYAALLRNKLREWQVLDGPRERVKAMAECRGPAEQKSAVAVRALSPSLAYDVE